MFKLLVKAQDVIKYCEVLTLELWWGVKIINWKTKRRMRP